MRFENVALAWPCTTLFRLFDPGALCHSHSNDTQDLPWKWKFILTQLVVVVFEALTFFDAFLFDLLDRFSKYAHDRTTMSNTLLQGEGKAQQLVHSERERPRERIRTMIAVALFSWCINTVTFHCYERFNTYD